MMTAPMTHHLTPLSITDINSITINTCNTMKFTTTVTQKGQVTLPKSMRQALGITAYDQVEIELTKSGKVINIKPTLDVLDLAGSLQPKANKSKSVLEARQAMEKEYERV